MCLGEFYEYYVVMRVFSVCFGCLSVCWVCLGEIFVGIVLCFRIS